MKVIELRQKRAALVKQAREILDKAEAEGRDMTAEENQMYDRIFAEVDKLGQQIEREERLLTIEGQIKDTHGHQVQVSPDTATVRSKPRAGDEYRAAFVKYIKCGETGLNGDEKRALVVGTNEAGGYLVPEKFVTELIQGINDAVYIRKYARIHPVSGAVNMGVPVIDADDNDADWTSEVLSGNEDTQEPFGKRVFQTHPLAKKIKVSNTLLRTSPIDVDVLVRERFQAKFARSMEKAYLLGNGSGKPLGLFVASSDGIPATRDKECGTTSAITADGLIDVKYSLKQPYWAKAVWIMHRDVLKAIRKLKDDNGQYIWQPGLKANGVDTLLDSPVLVSEYAPNTLTAGQYVCLYGDLSYYWIMDSLDFTIQRLVELYAETNQTGFIGRYEGDGMPVLAEAFVRGKLAEAGS